MKKKQFILTGLVVAFFLTGCEQDQITEPSKWNVNLSSRSIAAWPALGIDDWWWTAENVWQENGDLVLRVTKEDENTMHCGSVNSKDLYETHYGYFETRIKIADASKGTHTAFWLQGDNMGNVDWRFILEY